MGPDTINPFLSFDAKVEVMSSPQPSRVYAFIDQIEPVGEAMPADAALQALPLGSGPVVVLDCVDANWFDQNERRPGNVEVQRSYFEEAPLYLIEMRLQDLSYKWLTENDQAPDIQFLRRCLDAAYQGVSSDGPPLWLELELFSGGGEALLYYNLFGGPVPVTIKAVRLANAAITRKLKGELSLDDLNDASEDDVKACLIAAGTIDHAVVYDVGQGSSNGFCSAVGSVAAYADLGGGVKQHSWTFPTNLKTFCFSTHPPVILSHWDYDHWSSANRDTRALNCTWIAPRQPMGAVQRTLAFNIQHYGRLLLWPGSKAGNPSTSVAAGQITIELCTGPKSSRNQSGLAVLLYAPKGTAGKPMLFPGDAAYDNVPSYQPARFEAAAVPHHGGDMGSPRHAPICPGKSGRIVYSYGQGHPYGHGLPNSPTRLDHAASGWTDMNVSTCSPAPGDVRQTEDRATSSQLGHVQLSWGTQKSAVTPPCNGACQLKAEQT